jgi:transposase
MWSSVPMDYEPQDPSVVKFWQRVSPELRAQRLAEARQREAWIAQVEARSLDESEAAAIERVVPGVDRTTFRGWRERYRRMGLDGLIDRRMAPESPMPPEVRATICALRRADPGFAVAAIVEDVKKTHQFETSETVVKRVLKEAGLNRRRGPSRGSIGAGETRLELGGMKLVEAAMVETGYVSALVTAIDTHMDGLPAPAEPTAPDTSDRDEFGRFLPSYNERFRKGPDDAIGPGFASVEDKRADLDPSRLQAGSVRTQVLERKIVALLGSPLIGSGRWDGMRVPRGDLLGELCGLAYMPATLDRFTRELKYAGVASTLWETHARKWLEVSAGWGPDSPSAAAAIYVDGTTKPVWTSLFSQSSKVSSVGRTMPAIEQVAFHTGYGVPLWMLPFSGRAPLVKVVPDALARLDAMLGPAAVGRIVVIDAEGNSIPFLRGLESAPSPRGWVTRLRDGWVAGKRIFNRTNFRPYRDGERVRAGVADFPSSDGDMFRMRVVELERRRTGELVYLGASVRLDEREWNACDIADLYFDRWPNQEANFRAVNQAVGAKDVHGYGKRLVDNVSVVTRLDELSNQLTRAGERRERQSGEVDGLLLAQREQAKTLARQERRMGTVERHLEPRLEAGRTITPVTERLVDERRELSKALDLGRERQRRGDEKLGKARAKLERTDKAIAGYRQEQHKLESRRQIFAHDVELDSLFALLKFGLVLLVTHVLRTYLGGAKLAPTTFLERIATLPARMRRTPDLEIVTFDYNRRDPDMMAILIDVCAAINERRLQMRSGRVLRVHVDPAPKPARPPPTRAERV